MSNTFKLHPTYFSRGGDIYLGGVGPLVTGLFKLHKQTETRANKSQTTKLTK